MTTRLDEILQQYGLNNGAPPSAPISRALNPMTPAAPGADTDSAGQPTQNPDPMANLSQAIDYAKQLGESAAHAAKNIPGPIGNVASAIDAANPNALHADAPTIAQLLKQHESGGNYSALNQQGSTASGAYQYTDPTWAHYGGYSRAALAPRQVQDQRAIQDIAANLQKFGNDPFKTIAAHYLPAAASNPAVWSQPYRLPNGKTVPAVADYVRATVKNTPLQEPFDVYLRQHTG
jgi:Transglycosylase-like domain